MYPTYYFEHKPYDITTTNKVTTHAMPSPNRCGSPCHKCIFAQPLSHLKIFLTPETIEFSSALSPTLSPWLCSKWNLSTRVTFGDWCFWSVWHPVLKSHPRCCAVVIFFLMFWLFPDLGNHKLLRVSYSDVVYVIAFLRLGQMHKGVVAGSCGKIVCLQLY